MRDKLEQMMVVVVVIQREKERESESGNVMMITASHSTSKLLMAAGTQSASALYKCFAAAAAAAAVARTVAFFPCLSEGTVRKQYLRIQFAVAQLLLLYCSLPVRGCLMCSGSCAVVVVLVLVDITTGLNDNC